jgi:hypothetical protein
MYLYIKYTDIGKLLPPSNSLFLTTSLRSRTEVLLPQPSTFPSFLPLPRLPLRLAWRKRESGPTTKSHPYPTSPLLTHTQKTFPIQISPSICAHSTCVFVHGSINDTYECSCNSAKVCSSSDHRNNSRSDQRAGTKWGFLCSHKITGQNGVTYSPPHYTHAKEGRRPNSHKNTSPAAEESQIGDLRLEIHISQTNTREGSKRGKMIDCNKTKITYSTSRYPTHPLTGFKIIFWINALSWEISNSTTQSHMQSISNRW